MRGRLSWSWAVAVAGGVGMSAAALMFAAFGDWMDAGLSAIASAAFAFAGRQSLMVVILAGALARRDDADDETSNEGNNERYLP